MEESWAAFKLTFGDDMIPDLPLHSVPVREESGVWCHNVYAFKLGCSRFYGTHETMSIWITEFAAQCSVKRSKESDAILVRLLQQHALHCGQDLPPSDFQNGLAQILNLF